MDIKNLISFIYVAEMNSFTKAAAHLGYTQSTVSFQIKQLENEMNCKLFERINHSVILTQRGKELLDYAHRVKKMTDELMDSGNDRVRGNVAMATASSLMGGMLKENYADFYKRYPDVKLKVLSGGTEEMLEMLDHSKVDMVLTMDSHIYNNDYVIAKEKRIGVHFVANIDLDIEETASIEDVLAHPLILTEKGMSYRRIFEEKLAEKSLGVEPVLEIGDAEIILSLVEKGVGISLLPDYITENAERNGVIKYIHVDGFEIEVWKQLLYHKNKWISREMKAVLDYCTKREFA